MNKFIKTLLLSCTLTISVGCQAENQSFKLAEANQIGADQPNVLIIIVDDLGFSDIGAFGGEIDTPHLDSLAMSGIRLTSFYTAPTCSPTRSMLLTGKDSHTVGLGVMEETIPFFPSVQGKAGYEGYLNPATTTIAEALSTAGYRTMMTGKWHLGRAPEQQPSEHGFTQSYILQQGASDHFGYGQNGTQTLFPVAYTENGKPVTYPVGEYSSDFYAEKMIEYMSSPADDRRPFFAYLAFTAPHWPLQAPKELIAKYKGRYDSGPSAKRALRLKRMQELGLLNEATLNENLKALANWEDIPKEERAILARKMEIYAAMVDSIDQNVGKVLQHLESSGQLENTVIVFMSDNGAEGVANNFLMQMTQQAGEPDPNFFESVNAANKNLEKMGSHESFLSYGDQWAQASMAPFREFKSMTEEGGIKSPAFITGPGIKGGRIVDGLLSVRDIMPTTLDIAGIPQSDPTASDDEATRGISWSPILNGTADHVRTEDDAIAVELFGRRAIRMGVWKAVYGFDSSSYDFDNQQNWSWSLYNVSADPGESNDVKSEHPQKFSQLMDAWDEYAKENGVIPLD